jgi:Dehydrogenases with different specificities (related to short-chain alcohol dehydrogenases)
MKLSYSSLFNLSNKTAVVTGGLGILGTHFCQSLAEFGANIAIIDIDLEKAMQFAKELQNQYGIKAQGFYCDVSNPESVEQMVKGVIDHFGEINILMNNAASKSDDLQKFFSPVEQYELDEWRKIMSVNIDGMFLVAKFVGKEMIKQAKGGSIIQTSSIYGIAAPDQRIYEGSEYLGREINTPAVYSTSKAAVIGLSRHLAALWAPHNIRVNTLVPGGVSSGQNEVFKQKYSNRVPLARMAEPHEMVGALIYLASDASSYVTGQCLIVDGGLSAW